MRILAPLGCVLQHAMCCLCLYLYEAQSGMQFPGACWGQPSFYFPFLCVEGSACIQTEHKAQPLLIQNGRA